MFKKEREKKKIYDLRKIMKIKEQGSKNPLVRSYLRVPQVAGQVKIWMISKVNYHFSHTCQ